MSLKFLTDSLLTTLQDLGRTGYRAFGVNPNGATDAQAVRLINALLGNETNEPVLELHYPAPKILFEKDAVICLGGANFDARIAENAIENWRLLFVNKGSVLNFANKIQGERLYLSVQGGFAVEKWLGSASANLKAKIDGVLGRKIIKGDVLRCKKTFAKKDSFKPLKISPYAAPRYEKSPTIRVTAGAEFELLTGLSEEKFLSESFSITLNSDRMGFRLNGVPLYLLQENELVSSAVNFGTIQLLPNGQLIILMSDHQTTGGYPRIANIISADLPILAQLGVNDKINFNIVTIEEAEKLALKFEKDLNFLKSGVQMQIPR